MTGQEGDPHSATMSIVDPLATFRATFVARITELGMTVPANVDALISLEGLGCNHYRASYSRMTLEGEWRGGSETDLEELAYTLADFVHSAED